MSRRLNFLGASLLAVALAVAPAAWAQQPAGEPQPPAEPPASQDDPAQQEEQDDELEDLIDESAEESDQQPAAEPDQPVAPQPAQPGQPEQPVDQPPLPPAQEPSPTAPGQPPSPPATQQPGQQQPVPPDQPPGQQPGQQPGLPPDGQRQPGQLPRGEQQQQGEQPMSQDQRAQLLRQRFGASLSTTEQGQLVVSDLGRAGIATNLGILPGDVIVSVDGRRVTSPDVFFRVLAFAEPVQPVRLVVLRGGRQEVILIEPSQLIVRQYRDDRFYGEAPRGPGWLGVYLDERYQRAVVEDVAPGSAAEQAGLRAGDWIVAVNEQRIWSSDHLSSVISQMPAGTQIEIDFVRPERKTTVATLGTRGGNTTYFYRGDVPPSAPRYRSDVEYRQGAELRGNN